ncbi:MAG: SIS domain-containing protein [Steroidobacteraceae bacterium]
MSNSVPGYSAADLADRGATWTVREIVQQPSVWMSVAQLIVNERGRLDAFLQPLLENPALRIILSGAGTSAFIGDCLAPSLACQLGRRTESIATTDIVSGPQLHLRADVPTLLISFARSGNSPESIAAVELAEQIVPGIRHLVITCNPEGQLAARAWSLRNALVLILPDPANDRGFAMTSSFTSMLLAAGLIFGTIRAEKVPILTRAAQALLPRAWRLAQKLVAGEFQRVVYLGSNELRALASEAALKLLELTDGRTVSLSQSALGFRHGPKTIVNDKTLVVVMLSNRDYTRDYDLDLLAELKRDGRAGEIVALTPRVGEVDGEQVFLGEMEDARDIELALLHILPAQAFALLQSLALGLTPDKPNAAGVVNRVVQGVNIYPYREAR